MKARTRSIYEINVLFKGYLHVVYNGSLYYHQQEESRVIRYELASERNTMVYLPNATVTGNVHIYAHVRISSLLNEMIYYCTTSQVSKIPFFLLFTIVAKLLGFLCGRNGLMGDLRRE